MSGNGTGQMYADALLGIQPVGPSNMYPVTPTMTDVKPIMNINAGTETSDPVFSDKEAGLQALWMRRDLTHLLWQNAINGNYSQDEQQRRYADFQAADNAWLHGQVDPTINPAAAQEDRWAALSKPAAQDADVMTRAMQVRQRQSR